VTDSLLAFLSFSSSMSSLSFHSDRELSLGVSLILGDYDGDRTRQTRRTADRSRKSVSVGSRSLLANTEITSENEVNPKLNRMFIDLLTAS